MKNIKFLFAFLLFVGMNANASETINGRENLIKQLSVDESFTAMLTNSSNINLTYLCIKDLSKMSPELIQDIKRLKLQNVELNKIVEDKYPAYKNLSVEDKKEVITTIFTTTFSQTWLQCVGMQFGNFVVCIGITKLFDIYSQAAVRSLGCFATAVAADVSEEALSGGVATFVMPAEAIGESLWCARIGFGVYTGTMALATICATETIYKVLKCGPQN